MTGALVAGGCAPVLAVLSPEAAPDERLPAGVRVVINPDPSRGQISSLRCCLDSIPDADGLLVVLIDQGTIQAATVRAIRDALRASSVAVARHRGVAGHPTGFARPLFPALGGELADRGARAVVEREAAGRRVRYVDVDDPGVIRNINTPEQYQAFLDETGLSR
jgi:CTP:molybdopterin cytidylyltransferase MocA